MLRNDNHAKGNLLNYLYHQNNYKVIGTDLSKQTKTNVPQQVNFIRKLESDGATMFLFH